MFITEKEAKEKWCPFFQISAGNTCEEYVDNRKAGYCLTSNCMAWIRSSTLQETGRCELIGIGVPMSSSCHSIYWNYLVKLK